MHSERRLGPDGVAASRRRGRSPYPSSMHPTRTSPVHPPQTGLLLHRPAMNLPTRTQAERPIGPARLLGSATTVQIGDERSHAGVSSRPCDVGFTSRGIADVTFDMCGPGRGHRKYSRGSAEGEPCPSGQSLANPRRRSERPFLTAASMPGHGAALRLDTGAPGQVHPGTRSAKPTISQRPYLGRGR